MADRTYTGAGKRWGLTGAPAQIESSVRALNGRSQAPAITFNQGGRHG